MKNVLYITLSILLFLQLGTGCKKEKALEPLCNDTNTTLTLSKEYELVWSVPDYRGFTNYGAVVGDSSVVFFNDPPGAGGDDIIALNKRNGDTLWIKPAQGSTSKQHYINGNLYYEKSDALHCINVNTGSSLWAFDGSGGYLGDYTYGNGKIFVYIYYNGLNGPLTKLFSLDPTTGVSQLEYTLNKADREGYRLRPKGLIYYQHPNGNEIIFCQSSAHNSTLNMSRGEYFAIDITNDSMYWDLGSFYNLNGIGSPPLLKGERLMFNGPWSQHTYLNLETKTIDWNTQVPIAYRTGGGIMLELNGKLFQSLGNAYNFNIINTSDGSHYKHYGEDVLGSGNWKECMKKANNHIYFSSGKGFFRFNSNGDIDKTLGTNEYLSSEVNGTIQGFDIDNNTGYIYATIGRLMVCFKEK